MLGPIRFINSDCEPNCEYDFSSLDKTLVRLRTLKKLETNDEVLVSIVTISFQIMSANAELVL